MQSFKNLVIFLFSLSVAAFVWGIVNIFLAKTPTFFVKVNKEYDFFYINLTKLFFNKTTTKKVNIKKIETLKGLILKAVYKNGKNSFIIVEDNRKTKFINLNDYYKGYKLIEIGKNYAIFRRNGRDYKISFKKEKINHLYKERKATYLESISKKVFKEYKDNLSKIWSNIGIIKVKEGYRITYLKKGSIFDKIGLKRGDILLEVNGRKLKNDADAWNLYKNADKFNEFEIKIKRNNQIKVLNYEVY